MKRRASSIQLKTRLRGTTTSDGVGELLLVFARFFPRPFGGGSPASLVEECQNLDRLAQSHVVGQTTPKAEFVEKMQPAEPLALVLTQFAGK